jgi:hypothetical protein
LSKIKCKTVATKITQHVNNHSFYYNRCHKIICKTVATKLSNNPKPFLKVIRPLPLDHNKPLPFTCLSSGIGETQKTVAYRKGNGRIECAKKTVAEPLP